MFYKILFLIFSLVKFEKFALYALYEHVTIASDGTLFCWKHALLNYYSFFVLVMTIIVKSDTISGFNRTQLAI